MTKLKTFLAAAIVALSAFSGNIAWSQIPSDIGPFQAKAQLVNYWQVKAGLTPNQYQIALNGYLVFSRPGGQPVQIFSYFQCDDGTIRAKCGALKGPYASLIDLSGVTEGMSTSGAAWRVFLGATLRDSFGAGPFSTEFHFILCPGSSTAFDYFVLDPVTPSISPYGTFLGTGCLPSL